MTPKPNVFSKTRGLQLEHQNGNGDNGVLLSWLNLSLHAPEQEHRELAWDALQPLFQTLCEKGREDRIFQTFHTCVVLGHEQAVNALRPLIQSRFSNNPLDTCNPTNPYKILESLSKAIEGDADEDRVVTLLSIAEQSGVLPRFVTQILDDTLCNRYFGELKPTLNIVRALNKTVFDKPATGQMLIQGLNNKTKDPINTLEPKEWMPFFSRITRTYESACSHLFGMKPDGVADAKALSHAILWMANEVTTACEQIKGHDKRIKLTFSTLQTRPVTGVLSWLGSWDNSVALNTTQPVKTNAHTFPSVNSAHTKALFLKTQKIFEGEQWEVLTDIVLRHPRKILKMSDKPSHKARQHLESCFRNAS